MRITFIPLQRSHFPLMVCWLGLPHVVQWWQSSPSAEGIEEKYRSYVEGYKVEAGKKKPIEAFIITLEETPIGYIQCYDVRDFKRDVPLDFSLIPAPSAALDFFIGEPSRLGKGLGAIVLAQFLVQHIWTRYLACFVDPEMGNIAAVRTYEKAGFKAIRQQGGVVLMLARAPE